MKLLTLLKVSASVSTLLVAASAVPAYAQATTAEKDAQQPLPDQNVEPVVKGEEIVVTGSRIARPNDTSPVPVSVVTGADLYKTGKVSIGDTLNDLPQLRNTFSQQNSTRFLGTRGLNLLDLRGLGSERTLVLVNGRRHVAGDILSTGVSPDINTFPTDLIDRVDVVTGGNSAVYGSDAIAGVVNFILKRNYEGVGIRGQIGTNINYRDAGNQYVSLVAGKNFADGRGNVAINAEYSHQSDYYASGRPYLARLDGFLTVDTDPAGAPNGSDGVPDRIFVRDIRSVTGSTGGMINIPTPSGACGYDTINRPYACTYLFQPDGSLIPQTGIRVGLAPNGSFIGGNAPSGRVGRLLALSPELNRYSFNAIGHFTVSDAVEPFFEAKYVRTEARGSQSGPFFSQGAQVKDAASFNRERPRLDNPYLTAQARDQITQALITGGARPASITGATRFTLFRSYVDLGLRDENIHRETYRGVMGVRGKIADGWNYEVSANYGEHRETNQIVGNVDKQRFLLAMDSVRDSTGKIVCRSQIDPAAAVAGVAGDPLGRLTADIAACVPINPFGDGSISEAARNYILATSKASGKITQFVANGFISGDSRNMFELPGGPVGVSLGAEYRRETNNYELDTVTQNAYTFYNGIPSLRAPASEVKEVFGEIRLPLVKDLPLMRELTLSGSGRLADYNSKTGTVFAYTGTAEWRPFDDLRIRGAYSRSVRAPNLNELYSAQGQNFAAAPDDPCSDRNIGRGSSNRAANCAAAGRPAGFDYVYTSSLEIRSGGNPDLREEKSKSMTLGFVYTPKLVPGLSIASDYYDIKVDKVIASISAQDILNQCYDSPTLQNAYCSLFQRAGANGGPRGEIPFQILQGSLLQSSLNFAKLTARGIDTDIKYRHRFDKVRLDLGLIWTHVLERSEFVNPDDPKYEDRVLGELGDPEDQVNFSADATLGKVTLGYKFRWIGKMYLNTWEDYNSINGEPPQNADYASVKQYPDTFYHDVRVGLDVTDKFNIYAGVDNVTGTRPPYGSTGVGGGSGIYDNRGRYGYMGVSAKF